VNYYYGKIFIFFITNICSGSIDWGIEPGSSLPDGSTLAEMNWLSKGRIDEVKMVGLILRLYRSAYSSLCC